MGESIVVTGRVSSSPRQRGSTTGQTCPDLLSLEGGVIGVIGEMPHASEQDSNQACLVVPADLVYDAFASMLRS